jgi:hypothetical protein
MAGLHDTPGELDKTEDHAPLNIFWNCSKQDVASVALALPVLWHRVGCGMLVEIFCS